MLTAPKQNGNPFRYRCVTPAAPDRPRLQQRDSAIQHSYICTKKKKRSCPPFTMNVHNLTSVTKILVARVPLYRQLIPILMHSGSTHLLNFFSSQSTKGPPRLSPSFPADWFIQAAAAAAGSRGNQNDGRSNCLRNTHLPALQHDT